MLSSTLEPSELLSSFMGVIAALYLIAAIGHTTASIGFGEKPYQRTPVCGKLFSFIFAVLDVMVFYGLWFGTSWGIPVFCFAAFTQILSYRFVPEWFATDYGHEIALSNIASFHTFTLVVFVGLLALQHQF